MTRLGSGPLWSAPMNDETISVLDGGRRLEFTFAAMLAYHGPGSPGGVAHAFKVMQRAFPLLDPERPPERRELVIETAFGGPGARDGFELVTRAVTSERYHPDPTLARPERGRTLERFVFRVRYRERTVTLAVREGFVPDALIELARRDDRTAAEEAQFAAVKQQTADTVMAAPATAVYDAELA
jgi:hypothetical protein